MVKCSRKRNTPYVLWDSQKFFMTRGQRSHTNYNFQFQLSHLITNVINYQLTKGKTLLFGETLNFCRKPRGIYIFVATRRNPYKFTMFVPPADQTSWAARACALRRVRNTIHFITRKTGFKQHLQFPKVYMRIVNLFDTEASLR